MPRRGSADQEDAMSDRAYDEAIPVESDDDVSTPPSSDAGSPGGSSKQSPAASSQHSPAKQGGAHHSKPAQQRPAGGDESESGSSEEGDESTSDSGSEDAAGKMGGGGAHHAGGYNPEDFSNMKVSAEVEELFQYITRYKPHTIELDTALKPFVPELIPSIGEVDAFLKMPRPDQKEHGLGATCLDEPTLNPSDPSILDLQLRSLSKNQNLEPMEVRSIENAEKNPKEIANWVNRIDDLNRSKPAPTVNYSRRMPDIEQLMQVWPAEFEEYLAQEPLPEIADLELELPEYTRMIASVLDVPVYGQITESLHVIFTLYSEFKLNQHFAKTDGGGFGNNEQYNFGSIPNFGASAAPTQFGGPSSESQAPSRAPSPVGRQQGQFGQRGP